MSDELLPCPNPWCEGAEREGDFSPMMHKGLFNTHYVACTSCTMDGPKCQTEAEAITAWNTRAGFAGISDPAAFIEAARGLFDAAKRVADGCVDVSGTALILSDYTTEAREIVADLRQSVRTFRATGAAK